MKSSNPILSKAFNGAESIPTKHQMSLNGVLNKSGLLLAIASIFAIYPWNLMFQARINEIKTITFGSMVIGFVVALCICFKPAISAICAPIYAAFEGFVLGGISAMLEIIYPGIALQAVAGTFATLGVVLLLYRLRLFNVNDKFRSVVLATTLGLGVIYFLSMVFHWFGVSVQLINGNGIGGIMFSLIVIGIASLNLILDFDIIERGLHFGAPRYMEWYTAFGLMVTMVWLYVEIIQLISKIRSRDS